VYNKCHSALSAAGTRLDRANVLQQRLQSFQAPDRENLKQAYLSEVQRLKPLLEDKKKTSLEAFAQYPKEPGRAQESNVQKWLGELQTLRQNVESHIKCFSLAMKPIHAWAGTNQC
jgi:hypothetical protein